VLPDLRINDFPEVALEPFVHPLLSTPIKREYLATSAARMAAKWRVEAIGGSPLLIGSTLGPLI
jgi:hypothetical protein